MLRTLPYIPVIYALDLSDNQLTDNCARPLMSILKRLPVLRSLCISGNAGFTKVSADILEKIIVNCTELQALHVARTSLTSEDCATIRQHIRDSK